MQDIEIIQRIKNGEIEAYSLLVERYHRQVLAFIYRLIDDRDLVEDIGQEVFLSVYKSLSGFDEHRGVPFSAWLFICAKNRCLSEMRSGKQKQHVPLDAIAELRAGDKSADEVLIEQEQRTALAACLEQLPEPYKSAILGSLSGQSHEEIAQKHKISVGTVKSRLARAKDKLKHLVHNYFTRKGYEGI